MMRASIPWLALALLLPLHVPAEGEKVVFFEDFSAPALDRTQRNVIVTGRTVNSEQQIGGSYPHTVNHTDAPYLGLPQSTVDTIAAGRAVMLVDWIRVSAR